MKNLLFLNILYIIGCGLDNDISDMLDRNNDYSSNENTLLNATKSEGIGSSDVLDVNKFSNKISDFFSKYESGNKDFIVKFFSNNSYSELTKNLEKFLEKASIRDKIKLKNDLKNCKTENDVKSILIETSVMINSAIDGYKIGENSKFIDKMGENGIDKIQKTDHNIVQENSESQLFGIRDGYNTGFAQDIELVRDKESNIQNFEDTANEKENNMQDFEDAAKEKEDGIQKSIKEIKEINEESNEYKAMLEAIRRRTELDNKYIGLKERTDKDSDQYLEVKSQLENDGVLKQLRQHNYSEEYISDYIVVATTLKELKNNEQNLYSEEDISGFYKLVKNLNNKLNIADTNLKSFSSENITQTRTELFNEDIGNDNLIKARNQNMESHDYSKILPEIGNQELISNYGNFLNGKLKEFWMKYQNDPELKNKIDNINDIKKIPSTYEERVLLHNYQTMILSLKTLKEKIDHKVKNMVEELCIISQIKVMCMCMGEGMDLYLNKSNEIRYDKEGAMILNGHIDGIDFSIRQDVNNPKAKLQTSQKLTKDENAFVVGGKDKFVDSNFILPSQNEIFDSISEIVKFDSSLVNFDNQVDYVNNLQMNIVGNMEEKYKDTELVHHYMKEQVKGQKIVNKVLGLIEGINPSVSNNETSMNITKYNNRKMYTFLKILKYNIDNSTDIEKDHFDWCIDEIGRVISNYKVNKKISGNYSGEISKCLENDIWIHGTQEQGLNLIFDLFNHFNENPISDGRSGLEGDDGIPSNMIINDLYMQLHDKPKEKKQQQERDYLTRLDIEDAESLLNQIV